MDYFVISPDDRAVSGKRVDYSNPAFRGEEPFVTWLELKQDERLPDFLWGGSRTQPIFCVSDEMKGILDYYGCLTDAVPVFLTDVQYRSQKVYWRIDLQKQDCLVQELYAGGEQLKFRSMPGPYDYMFQAVNERVWYPIVSLELAENLLRRHMYGLCFYPVRVCEKGA